MASKRKYPFDENHTILQKIELTENEINPWEIDTILDILFKSMSIADLKNCRLLSSEWNAFGIKELSKRPVKPSKFQSIEDLEPNGKLGQLLGLTRHLDVHSKLFHLTSFSFDINILSSTQICSFFAKFSPKFVTISGQYGEPIFSRNEEELERERNLNTVQDDLFKFLKIIAPYVHEIDFSLVILSDFTPNFNYYDELSRINFPTLRKISVSLRSIEHEEEFTKIFFYSIVGGNAPKFHHLKLYACTGLLQGDHESMVNMSHQKGFMSKLKILEFGDGNQAILKVFTEFGQLNVLKLNRFNYDNSNFTDRNEIQGFVNFITCQSENLKILHMHKIESFRFESKQESKTVFQANEIDQTFPRLSQLVLLQIDYLHSFSHYFLTIDFSEKFPEIKEFRTCNMKGFLNHKIGHNGDSVKSIKLIPNTFMGKLEHFNDFNDFNDDIDFIKFERVFQNLEFLECNFYTLPKTGSLYENIPFWMQLKKAIVHFEMKDLMSINLLLLKVIQNLEIDIKCGGNLRDEKYVEYLGGLVREETDEPLDAYNRQKFYENFLSAISRACCIHPLSFTIIGYKISDAFKRDFRSIFSDCLFVETGKS